MSVRQGGLEPLPARRTGFLRVAVDAVGESCPRGRPVIKVTAVAGFPFVRFDVEVGRPLGGEEQGREQTGRVINQRRCSCGGGPRGTGTTGRPVQRTDHGPDHNEER